MPGASVSRRGKLSARQPRPSRGSRRNQLDLGPAHRDGRGRGPSSCCPAPRGWHSGRSQRESSQSSGGSAAPPSTRVDRSPGRRAGYSAKDLRRPGIRVALEQLERTRADGLVVAKLDRLSRSLLDFAAVMAKAQKQGWALVALDCTVDTTTPAGEAMAHVLATFAQFERRLIGERTREALAAKKRAGVKLGRPRTMPSSVRRQIRAMRARGLTLQAIADSLNEQHVPTAQKPGARWHASTVRAALEA